MNSYTEAEQFLLSLGNIPRKEYMESEKTSGAYLTRIQGLLDVLGNPEKNILHYIHITGTSGKGSTTSFMHQILQESGAKVGSTISPHPTVLTERWKVQQKEMNKKEFIEIVQELKIALQTFLQLHPHDMPSFFEVTQVIALMYFAKKQVDYAVMEVGCGGRYDASNVIPQKDIALITNIGLDHQALLGNTKSKIAYDKAGIIKTGCTVFTTEQSPKIYNIIKKEAKLFGCPIIQIKSKEISDIRYFQEGTSFTFQGESYTLSTFGAHQATNAVLAIQAAKQLGIQQSAINKGLKKALQPMRMEIIQNSPMIILDGAHNEDKIHSSIETLNRIQNVFKNKRIHLLVGFSENKTCSSLMKQLSALNPVTVCTTRNSNNAFRKVANPKEIAEIGRIYTPKAQIHANIDPFEALKWSKKQLKKGDILLITGSIFLSGQLRAILQ